MEEWIASENVTFVRNAFEITQHAVLAAVSLLSQRHPSRSNSLILQRIKLSIIAQPALPWPRAPRNRHITVQQRLPPRILLTAGLNIELRMRRTLIEPALRDVLPLRPARHARRDHRTSRRLIRGIRDIISTHHSPTTPTARAGEVLARVQSRALAPLLTRLPRLRVHSGVEPCSAARVGGVGGQARGLLSHGSAGVGVGAEGAAFEDGFAGEGVLGHDARIFIFGVLLGGGVGGDLE